MRRLWIISVGLTAGSAFAALYPPKKADLDDLKRVIDERKRIVKNDLKPIYDAILDIEQRVGLRKPNGASNRPVIPDPTLRVVSEREIADKLEERRRFDLDVDKAFSDLPSGDKETYAKATRKFLDAQRRIREISTRAISLAQQAYGIDAPAPGEIVSGPPRGKPFGVPSFIGREATGGPSFNETVPTQDYGRTYSNGHIVIGPSAFDSPALLGATIFHESLHYKEYLTPGVDLRNVPESEVRVREAGRPFLRRIFGYDDAMVDEYDRVQAAYADEAAGWRVAMKAGNDPWDIRDRDSFPNYHSREHRPAEHFVSLAAILDQAKSERDDSSDHWDKLVDEDASAAEQVTAQAASWDAWRAKVDAERKAHEDALAAIEAARDPQWEALSEWVGRACSYIKPAEFVHDGIGSSTPDFEYIKWAAAENDRRAAGKHASDAADREYLLTHSVVLPKSVIERGLKAHKSSLGSCEKDIIGLLLAAPAPVRSEWLVDEIDYLKGGGALGIVVRGIAKGLKKGSEALVTGIAVPFIAVGNAIEELSVELSKPVAPSRSEPGGSDRPQRPERSESGGSRDVWHGSGAYGQLGGISSGGLTFH